MKNQSSLKLLISLIVLLSLIAAATGLFYRQPGSPYSYTNHRGETVTINNQGLYFFDTVSSAAQMQGNDLITLAVGIPLLSISSIASFKGSLKWRFLLAGTLGFFLYTYISMATLASFNFLFLVYVAIFSLSLFSFILVFMSFDVHTLPSHFLPSLPRVWMSALMFLVAGFIALAWLQRIISPLINQKTPMLENTTTLVIQFMDLGLIVPLAFISGIKLLQKNGWGYLLTAVTLTKGITLGLGVSAMAINMSRAGVPDSMAITIPFFTITLLNLVMSVLFIRSVSETARSE